jgi:hypothetical protein
MTDVRNHIVTMLRNKLIQRPCARLSRREAGRAGPVLT